MAKVRTYTGKLVDFDEIMRGHDKDQAVGNANMNARGDIIDDKGQIKQSKEERAREYNKNVSNSVIKSSLLDEVDDLPDPNQNKKKSNTKPQQTPPKTAPKKSTVSEDFDDIDEPVKPDQDQKNDITNTDDGDKK